MNNTTSASAARVGVLASRRSRLRYNRTLSCLRCKLRSRCIPEHPCLNRRYGNALLRTRYQTGGQSTRVSRLRATVKGHAHDQPIPVAHASVRYILSVISTSISRADAFASGTSVRHVCSKVGNPMRARSFCISGSICRSRHISLCR